MHGGIGERREDNSAELVVDGGPEVHGTDCGSECEECEEEWGWDEDLGHRGSGAVPSRMGQLRLGMRRFNLRRRR